MKMPNLIACRACLAVNIRMHSLSSTWYAEMYEKLAGSKLVLGDGPDTICYMCSSRLQTFNHFFHMSQKAEQTLTLLLQNGIEFTQETANMLEINSFNNFTAFYPTPWEFVPSDVKEEIKHDYEDFGGARLLEFIEGEPSQDVNSPGADDYSFETVKTYNNPDLKYNFLDTPIKLEFPVKEENDLPCSMPKQSIDIDNHGLASEFVSEKTAISSKIFKNKSAKPNKIFEEKPYKCEKCDVEFYSKSHYTTHINMHKRPFPCNQCSKSFNEQRHLKRHLLIHSGEKPFECHVCLKKFNEKSHMTRHMQCLHGEKAIKCEKCDEKYETATLYKAHVKLHAVIKCDECTQEFTNKSDLKTHMKTHAKSYSCETCGKIFRKNYRLNEHKIIHTGDKPYACKCGKSFYKKSHLTQHETTHTRQQTFTCDRCGALFHLRSHFTAHLSIHSELPTAHISEQQLSNVPQLTTHQTDHGEVTFECDICAKVYKDKGNLKRHISHHNAPYLFACHICGKNFTSNYHFQTHLRTHTGERPFCCKLCSKKFSDASHYRAHLKTHSGLKPFACSFCNKSFVRNFTLKKHIMTHTKELPFQCNVCSKRFNLKQNLQGHMRTHTGEKPYFCGKCDKCFRQASHLKTHMKIHPT